MNKKAIGLLFIVIITISVLSYFLFSECPAGKERKGFKCVDKASTTTTSRSGLVGVATGCSVERPFKDGNSCVSSCPFGKVADAAENCVIPRQIIPMAGKNTTCPLSHQLKEYGTCVNACAPGLFRVIDISECVQSCPQGRSLLHNGQCLASCPSGMFRDLSNGVTPICVASCPSARPANGNNCQSCRERVPSLVNSNGQCATSCPAGTFRNDISMCVPINSLASSSITRTQIDPGVSPNNLAQNMTDGNFDNYYTSTSGNATWVYFQNIIQPNSGKKLYGFTIKFQPASAADLTPIRFRLYRNMSSQPASGVASSDSNYTGETAIYDTNDITASNNPISIRYVFPAAIETRNLALRFSKKMWIHEFEVTVR